MKRKKRAMTNMKFIGHLFLRQLLSVKVITSVIEELIYIENEIGEEVSPQEFQIECVLELIMNIGYTLELLSEQTSKN